MTEFSKRRDYKHHRKEKANILSCSPEPQHQQNTVDIISNNWNDSITKFPVKNIRFQPSFAHNSKIIQGNFVLEPTLSLDYAQKPSLLSNKEENSNKHKENKFISKPKDFTKADLLRTEQPTTANNNDVKKGKANAKPKKSYGQLATQMKCKQVIVTQLGPFPEINSTVNILRQKPPINRGRKSIQLAEHSKKEGHFSSKKHSRQRNPFKESHIHSGWKIERRVSPLSKSSSTNQGSIMQSSNSRNIQSTSLRNQEKPQENTKNAEQFTALPRTDRKSSEGSVESSNSRNNSLFKSKLHPNKSKDTLKDSHHDSVHAATRKKIKQQRQYDEMQVSLRVRTPSYAEKKRIWAGEHGVFSKNRLSQWYSSFQE